MLPRVVFLMFGRNGGFSRAFSRFITSTRVKVILYLGVSKYRFSFRWGRLSNINLFVRKSKFLEQEVKK